MSSQSATNRVKDLKAKLLGKQRTQPENPESSPIDSVKGDFTHGAAMNPAVRSNPGPVRTTESTQSITSAMNREQLVNLAIASKMDLAEDRAFSSLVKSVMLYVFDGSTGLEEVERAVDAYIAKDVALAALETNMVEIAMDAVNSARVSLEESNRDLAVRFPEFYQLVSDASTNKRRRLEYNEKATGILAIESREQSQARLQEMSEVLDALRQSNRKLARTIEYRRQQMEPLVYWTNVLETGRF